MLIAKEIKPEFIPIVQNGHDVRNIDPSFTKQPLNDTPSSNTINSGENKFPNFTFNKEAEEAERLLAAQKEVININP